VGVLGGLVGGLGALVLAFPLAYLGAISTPVSTASLAGVIAGALVGVFFPGSVFYAVQGSAYFLLGFFEAFAGGAGLDPPSSTPRWLWVAFIFGVAYFVAMMLL
jgi:hypothetical protein